MANTMSENFKHIKTESGQRTQKIGKIFRTAFSEAAAEVKAGAETVRPFAKEMADAAAETAKFKGQEVSTNVRQAFAETAVDEQDMATRLQLKIQAILKALRDTLLAGWNPETSSEVTVLPVEKELAAEGHDGVTVETLAL